MDADKYFIINQIRLLNLWSRRFRLPTGFIGHRFFTGDPPNRTPDGRLKAWPHIRL
jgi:hypothetical protein